MCDASWGLGQQTDAGGREEDGALNRVNPKAYHAGVEGVLMEVGENTWWHLEINLKNIQRG